MSTELIINGQSFFYPETNDVQWGGEATDWAIAVTAGMLQKAGGLFQLLADVDFGTTYGVKSAYYKSRTAGVADAGQIRLAISDVIDWRNFNGDGNNVLGVNASDEITWNGAALQVGTITVSDTATIDLTLTADNITADIKALSIDNSMISGTAAIAYSKLALTGSIVNADINASAAIAYSKLALTGAIVNADINASAAIAYSKLALTDSILNADINSAAAIAYSKLALSNSIVNADVNSAAAIAYSKLALSNSIVNADINSAAAIAYSKLALTGSIVNADISASAAIAFSKLATLSSGNILVGNVSNVAASVAVSGDIAITNAGVTAIGANKVTNAQLAQVATQTFKGRTSGSTGNVEDLTVTQATALLNAMVGDSGSGGTKGLVPAPASGDSAAGKFLKADGTWVAPSGAGDVVGPASSTDNGFAKFDGTTGKLLKNSAATISNSDVNASAAIALSKLAAVTASRALVSDGSGFVSAHAMTSAYLTGLNSMSARGDLLAGNATPVPAALAIGLASTRLRSNGTDPSWAQDVLTAIVFSDSPYTALANSDTITANGGSGAITINLPTAAGISGKIYKIKKIGTDFNVITIDANSTQTIDSQLTRTLTWPQEEITIQSDGSNWVILGRAYGDMATFTPTGTFTTNTTYTGIYWKSASNQMTFQVKMAFGGAPNSVTQKINIPNSWAIDNSLVLGSGSGNAAYLGWGNLYDASATNAFLGKIAYNSTTDVICQVGAVAAGVFIGMSNGLTQAQPVTIASSDEWVCQFTVPISGWL